jgi:GGDEF domain-containing protein
VSQIDSIRARWERDRLAKIADEEAAKLAIPKPKWVEKEITSNGNVNRFWVGDDMVVSFNWNDEDGTVWEHCDDRTRGLSNRVRTSVSIGSDRDAVMARISFLQAEASKKFAEKRARKEAYEAYKKAQEAGSRPIKSFDKWLQTTQISSSR